MPLPKYEILREQKVDRLIQRYLSDIADTNLLPRFYAEVQRANLLLKYRPFAFGEKKFRRHGENGMTGVVCAGGLSLFWIRYIVYRKIETVLIVDFGGRI